MEPPQSLGPARLVVRLGSGVGRGAVGVIGSVVTVTGRVGRGAERAVERLEDIAVGVQAMHGG